MVLPFASIPEGLREGLECSISRTVAAGRAWSRRPRNAWHSRGGGFDSHRLRSNFHTVSAPPTQPRPARLRLGCGLMRRFGRRACRRLPFFSRYEVSVRVHGHLDTVVSHLVPDVSRGDISCLDLAVPTPGLKDARSTEHRMRIAREGIELSHRRPEFLFAGEVISHDCLRDILERDTGEELDPTYQCSGLNQLHLHVFEPCLSQQARKAWAYVWIGAAELHRLGVPLDEPPEGGAVRFSEVATEVDVFDDGHAAHASVAAQRRDQSPGVGEVRQQKPRIDDIEQCVGLPLGDVLHLEHDIRQTESMRFPTSDVQLYLIEVDTHRSARRPSRPSEFEGHITAAVPTSRHAEPAGMPTSASSARVDGPITSDRRRSRSRPSTPPRITYLSVVMRSSAPAGIAACGRSGRSADRRPRRGAGPASAPGPSRAR